MSEYESVDDYINAVKRGIKWRRARDIVTRELADHINDLYDALLSNGIEKKEALAMAIREMGNAEMVAAELNSVHRPKTNWQLILAVLGLLAVGIITKAYVLQSAVTKNDVFAVLGGIAAAAVLYFCDYTVIIRKPRLLYWLLSGLTAVSVVYELRNGARAASYHYSFYFLLLFPVINTGIAIRTKEKRYDLGLFFFGLYFILPILAAFLIGSLLALLYLAVSYIVFTVYMTKKKWIPVSKPALAALICVTLILVLGMAYTRATLNAGGSITFSADTFTGDRAARILLDAPFIGNCSEYSELLQKMQADYPLIYAAAHYGKITILIIVYAYAGLLYLMGKAAVRQNTHIGYMIAWTVFIIISFQFALSILCSFGIIGGEFMMSFPFLTGGSFTLINLVLIGILLSVSRNEDIAKDWIKLKSGGQV